MWVSTRQWADAHGRHIKTVQRYAREGVLESIRVGGRVYVREMEEPRRETAATAQSVGESTRKDYTPCRKSEESR